MLKEEAVWFGKRLEKIPSSELSVVLNLGSGDKDFRSGKQPWIQKYLFDPLEKRGVKVIHLDAISGDVVDMVLDFENEKIVRIPGLKSVFANNLLEHVENPKKVAGKIEKIIPVGGYIFVSVPYKYPYHPSPRDNMLRPNPYQLASFFPKCKIIAQDIVYGQTFLNALSKERSLKIPNVKYIHSVLSHLTFVNRKFAVSCLVLQKTRSRSILT